MSLHHQEYCFLQALFENHINFKRIIIILNATINFLNMIKFNLFLDFLKQINDMTLEK